MRIAVIGTGYVGLVTGACLAHLGHDVTCVDKAPERVAAVNRAEAPFHEPGLTEMLSECVTAGRLLASNDGVGVVAKSDLIFLAVGTPCRNNRIDLSYLSAAAEDVGKGLRRGKHQTVIVKSTVVPGTTDTLIRGILERASGLRLGSFGLCANPEFLREGSAVSDFMGADRIVVGQWDKQSGAALSELYGSFECPKLFTTLRNAEMIKYASNAFLATLVSFSNEFAAICEATPGTDVEEVLNAVHLDRRLSYRGDSARRLGILTYLRAGCGYGGSCLPKDVSALRHYARQQNVTPHLLDAVAEVNAARPQQLIALATKAIGSMRGATVAVLGLVFKPDTDDLRDSQALVVAKLLQQNGATVRAYDPMISALEDPSGAKICATAEEALTGADAAIITTAWPEFTAWNWAKLCSLMRRQVVVDGRNALMDTRFPESATYIPIGKYFELQRIKEGAIVGS
jgi:UDPglucose 6-dehydrogenase/GDP-mannose 6-dehydrogenase